MTSSLLLTYRAYGRMFSKDPGRDSSTGLAVTSKAYPKFRRRQGKTPMMASPPGFLFFIKLALLRQSPRREIVKSSPTLRKATSRGANPTWPRSPVPMTPSQPHLGAVAMSSSGPSPRPAQLPSQSTVRRCPNRKRESIRPIAWRAALQGFVRGLLTAIVAHCPRSQPFRMAAGRVPVVSV